MTAGELWSLSDRRVVVAIKGQIRPELWTAVVVQADEQSGYRVGDDVVVREQALSQRWTVKPLTGVAREVQA